MAKKPTTEQAPVGYPKIIDMRLTQLRFTLDENKADSLAVTYLPNIRYLTNFSGSNATLFISDKEIHFITDDRYEEQVKTELFNLPNMHIHISRDPWNYLVEKELMNKPESMLFEADRVSYSEAVLIRNIIRPIKFKPVATLVERFTVPKSPEEVEFLQKSANISIEVYEYMLNHIEVGMSEKEIELEIAYQTRKRGSEGDPFDIIVVSGERGSLVHGKASDRLLKKGDILIMDFGSKYCGFCSDITRTVAIGKATKEQRSIYKLLWEAKEAAIEGVLPGMNGKSLDKIARSIIQKAGYGDNFQHSLGHGIGLETHESPIITFRKDDQIIPENSVLAIEPGVYLTGKFGMRVEDMIIVTKSGGRHLTKAPDELPVIE
jgi:Xaa-Pro aminopeptidase